MKLTELDPKPFWFKVIVRESNQCWPWAGSRKSRDGYGNYQLAGRTFGAHRVAFALARRVDPAGSVVRHTCDNPRCCNPEHLVLGTQRQNIEDRVARGRSATGSRNGNSHVYRYRRSVMTTPLPDDYQNPAWADAGRVHEWKNYISEELQAMWPPR